MNIMTDRNSKNIAYPSQFGIFLGLTGAGLIIGTLITVAVWKVMTGQSIFSMEKDMFNPKYYNAIMVVQVVSTFLLFFAPAFFYAMICYKNANKFIGFNAHFNFKQVILVIGILLFTFPFSGALAELNKVLPIPLSWATKFKAMEAARELEEAALININSFSKYLISLVVIALLPALFEEVFFRAGMQNLFTRWFKGPWVAIILTSIIFSLVHLSYYGFLVRAALGVILGLIFYYGKSVWLNVLFHFLFNGLQVTALYKLGTSASAIDKKITDPDLSTSSWLLAGLVMLAIITWLFGVYKKTCELQLLKYPQDEETIVETDFERWTRS